MINHAIAHVIVIYAWIEDFFSYACDAWIVIIKLQNARYMPNTASKSKLLIVIKVGMPGLLLQSADSTRSLNILYNVLHKDMLLIGDCSLQKDLTKDEACTGNKFHT